MIKQCTSSRCRRIFDTATLMEKRCPHCGKRYPRMSFGSKDTVRFDLVLVSGNQSYPMIYTARCIGRLLDWEPAKSIRALKQAPVTLATGLTRDNAVMMKEAMEKVGAIIKAVPHR